MGITWGHDEFQHRGQPSRTTRAFALQKRLNISLVDMRGFLGYSALYSGILLWNKGYRIWSDANHGCSKDIIIGVYVIIFGLGKD